MRGRGRPRPTNPQRCRGTLETIVPPLLASATPQSTTFPPMPPNASPQARHLLAVWNPSYDADALDAHVSLLLTHAREFRDGQREEDDVYVWWGKLRSPYRQEPLPHLPAILALDESLQSDNGDEHHLYLTDYRSLYVAHLAEILADDVRLDGNEAAHIPAYYRNLDLLADCWFRLWDIRRLVLDDTPAVIEQLRALRNARYHDQRVSLYGGMVDLPLLVARSDDQRWFDQATRDLLTDGRHWVEFDAERGGTGETQRDLRENRFGGKLWLNLDPAARAFIATAERLFRDHRTDAAFDLSVVIVNFAKAVEVQVNALLRAALANADRAIRLQNMDGQTVDLLNGGPWMLAQLALAITADGERREWLQRQLIHGAWFTGSLPAIIEELRELRNDAAHGGQIERERVSQLRGHLIGVGCNGSLLELAHVKPV